MNRLSNGLTPDQDRALDNLAIAISAHMETCSNTACSFCKPNV